LNSFKHKLALGAFSHSVQRQNAKLSFRREANTWRFCLRAGCGAEP